jgi:hypothetical protein
VQLLPLKIARCRRYNNSNQASSETVNNDPRLPPGFPKPLPPLDKEEIKQTDALIAEADGIIAKMDSPFKEIIRPAINAIKTMEIKDLCCVWVIY